MRRLDENMVDLHTKRKHDTFNCYEYNPFGQNIFEISYIKVPAGLRLHTKNTTNTLANQPSYIKNVKILTKNRENYQNICYF